MTIETSSPEKMQQDVFEYYNTQSANVIERTNLPGRGVRLAPFLSLIPVHAAILDAGCGAGYDSQYLLQNGYDVTGMDACSALVQFASQLTQQTVLQLKFKDINFENKFDGIWASASLLHVSRADMPEVLGRLARALKPGGVLFASFVHGVGQTLRGGILFNDYTEVDFRDLLVRQPDMHLVRAWVSPDEPPARPGREWLQVLVRKAGSVTS